MKVLKIFLEYLFSPSKQQLKDCSLETISKLQIILRGSFINSRRSPSLRFHRKHPAVSYPCHFEASTVLLL